MVMLEQLKTVNQTDLVNYIGMVDSEYLLRKINNGLKTALGLWVKSPQHRGEVRCLCGKCLQDVPNRRTRLKPFLWSESRWKLPMHPY